MARWYSPGSARCRPSIDIGRKSSTPRASLTTGESESSRGINEPRLYVQSHQDVGANMRCPQCDKPVKYAEPNRFTDAGAEALHADRAGCCSIFLRTSSQTDLTWAVITDA